MATKLSAAKPAAPQAKAGNADDLRGRMPAARRLPRVRAQAVLAALEVTKGERWRDMLARRGLKTG